MGFYHKLPSTVKLFISYHIILIFLFLALTWIKLYLSMFFLIYVWQVICCQLKYELVNGKAATNNISMPIAILYKIYLDKHLCQYIDINFVI